MASKYISREEMEAVIASGGGVLHKGVFITTLEGLPSKVELAEGDAEAEAAAQKELADEIAAKQAQLDASKKKSDEAAAAAAEEAKVADEEAKKADAKAQADKAQAEKK